MTSATDEVAGAFNPFDPAFRANPYPVYNRIRDEAPAHRSPFGFPVFSRHADCTAILHGPHVSSDQRNSTAYKELLANDAEARAMAEAMAPRRPFLFMDPPDHTRLRGLVSKAFTPRTVERLRPRIQQLTEELIDVVESRRAMDVIEDLAYPLPVAIISEMLGVPGEDHEMFKAWSRHLARSLDPDFVQPEDVRRATMQAVGEFHEYFRGLIARRRADPRDDLVTALVAAEDRGDTLTEDEVLSTCTLLLVAGHETTVNLIGNGVLTLLRNPDQLRRLHEEPSLLRSAVEEILRYDPPVQFDGRVVMQDFEIGGLTLRAGESPLLLLGAANRDPEVFRDPDGFDVGRTDNRHLSFGHGSHFCLGASLARLEGQIALGTIARRLPELSLAAETVEYKENLVLRGLASLAVTF